MLVSVRVRVIARIIVRVIVSDSESLSERVIARLIHILRHTRMHTHIYHEHIKLPWCFRFDVRECSLRACVPLLVCTTSSIINHSLITLPPKQ